MTKAITAFQNRAPGLRHGIARDRHVTIMLSQNEDARPLCGIYFNLHSPSARNPANAGSTNGSDPLATHYDYEKRTYPILFAFLVSLY